MAYEVIPAWADVKQPVESYDRVSGPKVWQEVFTVTDLDSTLRKATRAISCKVFSAISIHLKNTGAKPLTDLKLYASGAGIIDANGDLYGLSSNPSEWINSSLLRSNVNDPTTLAADTECDIVLDSAPPPSAIQIYAQAADANKTDLEITVRGLYT